ncbi:complement regulator-acquiring protein (plasmid) [Borreliella turdi]|uniref:complement regulator-acquiring protein n=1 Tax=Borreliella turdi TaxID=57863 RepID=UPI002648EF34|nr:complement regulator-acquiring protein [Borreliella turdi]WKC78503.1 complement regulator-acquiring protein [Borreliella turdi]
MKIKPLINLKCIALFLFSCTVEANLDEDYKNKVAELLNSTTNDQAELSINTNSNAAKNQTNTNKVANSAGVQKQAQSIKNKGLQNLPQQKVDLANLANLPKSKNPVTPIAPVNTATSSKNTQIKVVMPPKQIASTRTVKPVSRKTTKTHSKRINIPRKHALYSGNSQPISQTSFIDLQSNNFSANYRQAQPSAVQTFSGDTRFQTIKNDFLVRISEEKNKTHNNGFRETYDQFKMKDSAFTLLDVISNAQVFDRSYAPKLSSYAPEAESNRHKFYAMMNFDQSKITQFGSMMEILFQEDKNHNLIRSLIRSGLGIQIPLDFAIEEIEKKTETFFQEYLRSGTNGLDFSNKIQDLESKLNSILNKKNEWFKQVDALISNVQHNSNLKDPQSLAQYIEAKYLDKMKDIRQFVLNTYIDITNFK